LEISLTQSPRICQYQGNLDYTLGRENVKVVLVYYVAQTLVELQEL